MIHRAFEVNRATYRPHRIHGEDRLWPETNCYMDVLTELLHTLGHEPVAALACTLAQDFEGDQWTFVKFSVADLHDLFGLEVQELAVWRPLADHIGEQLRRGRPVLIEVDAYHLPDTAGTTYRSAHGKTAIAAVEIDIAARHLGYFHNRGYHHLEGDDFLAIVRDATPAAPEALAPYVEYFKIRRPALRPESELRRLSLRSLRRHLALAPRDNPFARFRARLEQDLQWLRAGTLEQFHAYAFVTFRQVGANFELGETYLSWLRNGGVEGLEAPAREFRAIAEGAKAMQYQLARSVSRRSSLDLAPLDAAAERWERAVSALRERLL